MRIPAWVTLAFAVFVIAFGSYRIYLATRRRTENESDAQRGGPLGAGLYRMKPRTQLLVGIVYLLLGAALIATTFGWNPIGGAFGPKTVKPAHSQAPTSTGIPIDHLPKPR